jgi:formylglycine-generating enzyme
MTATKEASIAARNPINAAMCEEYPGEAASEPAAKPAGGEGRVMRGGPYLCHESDCNRYRVAARTMSTPDRAITHVGFRCPAEEP